MKAIILAAGEARRLGPVAENKPKCLLKIGQKRIIDYQIQALVEAKIEDLAIVVGLIGRSSSSLATGRRLVVPLNTHF